MPCNTAHYYLPAIARSVSVPVLDMAQLAIQKLAAANASRVGMLASPAVRMVGLYKARMEQAGLHAVFAEPQDEETHLGIIKAVKAGRLNDTHRQDYGKVAGNLLKAGAAALLVACTEFSIIGRPAKTDCLVVDALDGRVVETIAMARGEP